MLETATAEAKEAAQEVAKEMIRSIEDADKVASGITADELAHLQEVYAPYASAKAVLDSFSKFISRKYGCADGDVVDYVTGKITRNKE